MPTADELLAMIRLCGWPELRALWEGVRRNDTPGRPPGEAFEYLVLRAFELDGSEGVKVRYPYRVELFGEPVEEINGAIHLPGLSCLVECKDLGIAVPFAPIAKMRSQLLRRPAGLVGVVFASGEFSRPAVDLAHFAAPQTILLWPGGEFDAALERGAMAFALRAKYRGCVEEAVPNYDFRSEEP